MKRVLECASLLALFLTFGCAEMPTGGHGVVEMPETAQVSLALTVDGESATVELEGPSLALDDLQVALVEAVGGEQAADDATAWLTYEIAGSDAVRVPVDLGTFEDGATDAALAAVDAAADLGFAGLAAEMSTDDGELGTSEQALRGRCPMCYCDSGCWCLYNVEFSRRTIVCSYGGCNSCGGGGRGWR